MHHQNNTHGEYYTHVLATVYCPAWARSWANMLLSLVVQNATAAECLKLLAVKGGPACDEECAFVFVLLAELGFRCTRDNKDTANYAIQAQWRLSRKDAPDYIVSLYQYYDVQHTDKQFEENFAPTEGYTCAPLLQRFAVISCAEKWFIDGQAMRINPKETDETHADGMTVNDRLNANLVTALQNAKARAIKKGFRPLSKNGNLAVPSDPDPVSRAKACDYFDIKV